MSRNSPTKLRLRPLLLAVSITLLASCAEEPPAEQKGLLVPIAVGDAELRVEIVANRQAMARGLMFRDSLPTGQGMLFVYRQQTRLSFWMKNTTIPLDIGFFTPDGVLREIYPLYPLDENAVKSARDDLLYALEVNQGWFAEHGVKPGDKLDVEAVLDWQARRK